MGEKTRALTAAEVAFCDEISLENYQRVAEIAGEQWTEQRTDLLNHASTRNRPIPRGK